MLKKLTIAAMLLICIASCKSKEAFNYSESFVEKENSLTAEITATEANVKRHVDAQRYDSIAIEGEKMEKLVDARLREIKNAPAPNVKEADNFKEACIKYFGFIKSIYTGYKEFGLAATADEREAAMNRIIEVVNKKQAAMSAVQTAQKKYADANGFKLAK